VKPLHEAVYELIPAFVLSTVAAVVVSLATRKELERANPPG